MRRRVTHTVCSLLIAGLLSPLGAQAAAAKKRSPAPVEQGFSLEPGIGFTAGPNTFLMALTAPYAFDRHFSLGPRLEIGVADNRVLVAPSANARYAFDLTGIDDDLLRRLRPYLQGGFGIAYVKKDRPGGDDDGVGGLIDLGFGMEYPLNTQVSLGSGMLFHIVPGSPAGETFYFSWEMLSARFRF